MCIRMVFQSLLMFVGVLYIVKGMPMEKYCYWLDEAGYGNIDWEDGKDRFCTPREKGYVCREWECPLPDCGQPLSSEYSTCTFYCPGTCTYGGKVHKIGDAFIGPDGFNTCWCGEDNSYFCSNLGFTLENMCDVHVMS